MNKNKNYYSILNISKNATEAEIKTAYRKLSFQHHPDKNQGVETPIFFDITEAYKNLIDSDSRKEYDMKSKFGNNYNEYFELFDINVELNYETEKDRLEKFKRNEILNIYIKIDDTFDGTIEYERYVKCKTCDGSGKDLSSKIHIRDNDGNILKTFDSEDGCDFCEGTGKFEGFDCSFCAGKGKVGLTLCKTCNGKRRILGKQKLKGIKLTGEETKVEAMGHYSQDEVGKVGFLALVKR